jgi:hypothetical protein
LGSILGAAAAGTWKRGFHDAPSLHILQSMAPRDHSPSSDSNESYADWDETASGRRPGDDPFLPEEGFFWWLPRALLLLLVLVAAGYFIASTVNRGKYQLTVDQGGSAQLERGRFAPSGWVPFFPDGALEAWASVPWPEQTLEAPLQGELVDLADTYLGFLRTRAAQHLEDDAVLSALEAQEEKFEAWYMGRWGQERIPQTESVKEQRTRRDRLRVEATEAEAKRIQREEQLRLEARAEEQARMESQLSEENINRARNYAARRRLLIREAEAMLQQLPSSGGT